MGPGDVHWWYIWIIMMLTDSTYGSWRCSLMVHMDPGHTHCWYIWILEMFTDGIKESLCLRLSGDCVVNGQAVSCPSQN